MRVLVVDDDEAGLYLAASMVKSAGHTAMTASDGLEALEAARLDPPDILITDILMPRMDGYQLAREWKNDSVLAGIPLVFLTASYTDPADEKFAVELGADGFLSKPVEPEVLLETIDRLAGGTGAEVPRMPLQRTEEETLREYSERVVRKLEQKLVDLERANEMLENAMDALGVEVEAKRLLIAELNVEIERRAAREAELRLERDFNRTIIETADVFIIGTDREGLITLFSPGAERASGYARDDVLGRDWIDTFSPPDEVVRRRQIDRALVEGRGQERMTNTWVMKDGQERVFEWSTTVTMDADGEVSGVIRFGIDVTDKMISTAVERVTGVIDLAVLLDRPTDDVVELAAAQAADEFGFSAVWAGMLADDGSLDIRAAAGPVAQVLVEMFEKDPTAMCPLAEVSKLASPVMFSPDAPGIGERWLEIARSSGLRSAAIVPVRAHGEVLGVVGALGFGSHAFDGGRLAAIQFIADRLGVALLVADARGQLQLQSAALESSASAIAIASADGVMQWVNPAFERLTEFPVSEVRGARLLEEGPGYRESGYKDAWAVVAKGRTWRRQVVNRTRSGREYAEDVTISPVPDDRGEITHVVIVKQDVSEQRRFEQLKSDFVAMVSHELRTPLTTIIGYADLMSVGAATLDPERRLKAIESIRSSGRRMQGIVESLLEVNELQAEGVNLEAQVFDVGPLVAEVVEPTSLGERHRLYLDIPDDLPYVSGDPRRLARALRNILENAVKYSPDGGQIGVTVSDVGEMVSIAVSDEGVGISEEQIPLLFEAFRQNDMSSTRTFGGVGLGLFVAYQLISAHGGDIRVQSREGVGSTFDIRLPIARKDDEV